MTKDNFPKIAATIIGVAVLSAFVIGNSKRAGFNEALSVLTDEYVILGCDRGTGHVRCSDLETYIAVMEGVRDNKDQ